MAGWRVDRGRPVGSASGHNTEYAYKMYLEGPDGEEAELTIEWVDGATGTEAAAHSVAWRHLQELVESEWPARRLIIARDGTSVAELVG